MKANAYALRTELLKKRKVDEESNSATWTPSRTRCETNAWRDCISHEIDVFTQLDADFNLPKIHLMPHWVTQILQYGALQRYSAETHDQAHKTNLMDGWNASKHNLQYLPQVIIFQRRILSVKIRYLNLQALAQHRENSAATCKAILSRAYLAAPLSSQSYAKPECMGRQTRRDGMNPEAIIKHFRALLDNTQDVTHCVTIYNSIHEFSKHMSHNKMYILYEQLHPMELFISHSIKVQVEGLQGELRSQMCQCTGSQSWRGGDQQNHWVWVEQHPGRCDGALNGGLPWQLQQQFKIKLLSEDGALVEYWLALALTTLPENSGNLDTVSNFVQRRNAPAAVALQLFTVDHIVG